jgi:hypothetical protein
MQYPMLLVDGTSVSVLAFAVGPSGCLATPRHHPILYLKDTRGRFYRVPHQFTEKDIPALEEKIQRPWPFGH